MSALPLSNPRFKAYDRVGAEANIVVDGAPLRSTILTLSHWPNNSTPAAFRRDTSTATVFAYLDSPAGHVTAPWVSNNHFDEDGLFSMFALCFPEQALKYRDLLIDASLAGDFGIVRNLAAARLCFSVEGFADSSISPLPAALFGHCEKRRTALLYEAMLERLPALLEDLDACRTLWSEHEAHLLESQALIEAGDIQLEEYPAVDLAVVTVPKHLPARVVRRYTATELNPVHPFAVNSATECNRVLYRQGHRYAFEYRYESWVQLASRRPVLRVALDDCCARLNGLETAAGVWVCDSVNEVTPRLRLEGAIDSGIAPKRFLDELIDALGQAPVAWDPYDWPPAAERMASHA